MTIATSATRWRCTASTAITEAKGALPACSPLARALLLGGLLRANSRAFYLSLRVLPRSLRAPVGLAYLLARAADTLSDAGGLPREERLKLLRAFRGQLADRAPDPETLRALAAAGTGWKPAEDELLRALPEAFALLRALPPSDAERIRAVLLALTQGMEAELLTFVSPPGTVTALPDAAALDRCTYLAAGCVGEFWTAMLRAHCPAVRHWETARFSELGLRFGKALQLVNLTRDAARDLRLGRCYLPRDELARAGLRPEELLAPTPETRTKLRPVLAERLRTALEHFTAAEQYLLAIPRRAVRLRLAAFWPLLMGLATLSLLGESPDFLDAARPVKVKRGWVRRMMLSSCFAAPSNWLLKSWIGSWRRRAVRASEALAARQDARSEKSR